MWDFSSSWKPSDDADGDDEAHTPREQPRRSPEPAPEDTVSQHVPSEPEPDPAQEPEPVEPPEPVEERPTLPRWEPSVAPESHHSDPEPDDDDEDVANLMFSLPDLPQREGDLRPVDPIAAFDEEFSATAADRASDLFPDPDPEPGSWDQPIEADDPEPVAPAADADEPPLFSAFSPATEPAPAAEPAYQPKHVSPSPLPESAPVLSFRAESAPLEQRFLGMLGELPSTISVFSPTGGVEYLQITRLDDMGRVIAYGPEEFTEEGFEITAELRDAQGSGYDIKLTVSESYFQAGDRALLHMTVADIIERTGERETPRAPVSERAEATIRYSAVLPEKSALEVRVADVSARGVALLAEKAVAVGDTMRVDALLNGRNVIMDVRVARVDPAAFGRYRMGCEITWIGAGDRAFLADLAAVARSGSPDERRPETTDVLKESRTEKSPLQERFGR